MKKITLLTLLAANLVTKPALADGIRPEVWVVSADWVSHLPPTGSVNAPERIDTLSPGQRIALAVVAEGPDRDRLFEGRTLDVNLEPGGTETKNRGLKSLAIRRIKAEGADMALSVLKAAGIGEGDMSKLDQATSVVTFAVFQPDWAAPDVDHPVEVRLRATISHGPSQERVLEPVTIRIRPWKDWAKQPEVDGKALSAHLKGYHDNFPPGLLLPYFESAAHHGALQSPAASEFFAIEFSRNPQARNAALHVLSREAQASIERIAPSPEAEKLPTFQDPVSVEEVRNIGSSMDRCWGAWMATGDSKYLRSVANVLGNADDYPALQAWQKAKGGTKGLNAHVARGLAYQIAGWSLGSFMRTDPHVADWLIYWENDPEVPLSIRHQIVSLPTNPAFRRQ